MGAACNAHDIEAVLDHFDDDVLFTSPVAALRDYWTTALSQQADLQFEVVGAYRGESTLVINYRNHRGQFVDEVLTFDRDGLVCEGHGTYLD